MKVSVTGVRGMPGVMGGVETHCEELLPRVARLDPALDIELTARAPYQPAGVAELGGVRIAALPSPQGRSSEAIVSTFRGVLHARKRRVDLLHVHAIGPALLVPLARLLGLRVVMTHHGADYDRAKWGRVAKTLLRLGEKFGVLGAQRVICVSPSLREMLAQRFPAAADRLIYIPNGAATLPPLDMSDADYLATLGLTPGGYVLNVARIVPEKGQSYLADAHASAKDALPLVIAGAAQHEDAYARKLAARNSEQLRLIGAVTRAQLGALYRNAALFTLPSFHEGLPIAALEAMACGCPMLLSDIPANLDLGLPRHNYAPVGDVAAWSAALGGDLSRYSIGGDAGAAFDWAAIAAATLAVYRDAARSCTARVNAL